MNAKIVVCGLDKTHFKDFKKPKILTPFATCSLYSCWLDQDIAPPTFFSLASWFWRQPKPIVHCSIMAPSYLFRKNYILVKVIVTQIKSPEKVFLSLINKLWLNVEINITHKKWTLNEFQS